VDDEEDIRTVLSKGLMNEGFTVQAEGNPVKALRDYRKGSFDLLLLDIRMPEMNGFELYREIRKLDPQVRVCFITAFEIYFDEFKRVFPKINVSCFVRKPVTISQLAKVVRAEMARPVAQEGEQAASHPKRVSSL
jgi:two-component system catabolic regulation response regulator CreB/two-component system response regulator ChvI